MSQNDLVLADQTFPEMLADLNSAFQALASNGGGAAAPSTTYPFQFWADETADALKMRNKANNAWLTLAMINPLTDRWELRADVIQALTAAGYTFKNAAGTTIASLSDAGVLSGLSITLGAGRTLNISAGILTLANDQIDGAKVKTFTDLLKGVVPASGGGSVKILRADGWIDPTYIESEWEAGTETIPGMPSPADIAAAIAAQAVSVDVMGTVAAAGAGAVGTYAFMHRSGNNPGVAFGDTIAGSSLAFAGVTRTNASAMDTTASGTSPSGTWRCLGNLNGGLGDTSHRRATLFLRIV